MRKSRREERKRDPGARACTMCKRGKSKSPCKKEKEKNKIQGLLPFLLQEIDNIHTDTYMVGEVRIMLQKDDRMRIVRPSIITVVLGLLSFLRSLALLPGARHRKTGRSLWESPTQTCPHSWEATRAGVCGMGMCVSGNTTFKEKLKDLLLFLGRHFFFLI